MNTLRSPNVIRFRMVCTPAVLAIAIAIGLSVPLTAPGGLAQPSTRAQGTPAVSLSEPEGVELLLRSRERADYGPLAEQFLTQANLAYCGVASTVMVLNSLAVPAPTVPGYGPYRFWTQENVFASGGTATVLEPETVARQGMTLAELAALLASHGLEVRRYHGDQLSLQQFRSLLRRSLADPEDRLLVNYDRRGVGQAGGGHISPLAAYDARGDRVLILDVARYRYPALWVPVADLWNATRSVDASAGLSRGVLTIRRPAPSPLPGNAPPPGPS